MNIKPPPPVSPSPRLHSIGRISAIGRVTSSIALSLIVLCTPSLAAHQFPGDCWGVYSWAGWSPGKVTREKCPLIKGSPIILKWAQVEPNPGRFRFEQELGDKLALAAENNFYTFLMIWVAPNAPRWLYDNGVPELKMTPTISPQREPRNWTFQYYLDEDYIRYYHRLLREFGRYVRDLPQPLRNRIVFIQSAEGSTGDGFCYKGEPLDERYRISRDQWSEFRMAAWEVLVQALSDAGGNVAVPLLVNYDSNRQTEYDWLMNNLDTIGLKNGMFSHGYHISDTQQRLADWRQFTGQVKTAGKTFFSRGEQDAEWQVCGWSSRNPQQALYWSALFATHCGLDMWNLPWEACQGHAYAPAINFFNKYASRHDAARSPFAFCALRKGLDAADSTAYPEAEFGTAQRSNTDRYMKIAAAFTRYGAIQGDPEKATGGGMKNRQRDNYNDVGWYILPGNYYRFLEQIAPDQTSTGWWHFGPHDSIYGRFARSFDSQAGKREMAFRLDEQFFPDKNRPREVTLRIVYLDGAGGTWALLYNTPGGENQAFRTTCRGTGLWKEVSVELSDAVFNRSLQRDSDLLIRYISGSDTIFHMIELESPEKKP